ncbi:alpha/beta fold hydrolase [Agromyces sp. MMS24-K17]|uniref:alpha/beta hydrolase family protein n=1 Tax=Agromyces sp. MMS24-K17 TaxID=3372850 RepID=UPI003754D7B1
MRTTEVEFAAADGRILRGVELVPDERPIGAIVVHAATAVPIRIYAPFAEALAERGFAVLRYDYRGTGASAAPDLRDDRHLRMRDWIDLDGPAATAWLRARHPDVPLLALGHSVGGHVIALGGARPDGTEAPGLDGAVIIASHIAANRDIPDPAERARVWTLLNVVAPVAGAVLGYVPGRRLALGEDLPVGVVREWRDWTRRRRYFFDDPTMDADARARRLATPTLVVGIADDPWSTPDAVSRFADHLSGAPVERLTVAPAPGEAIGHLGFFRRAHRETHWPAVLDWLGAEAQRAAAARATGEA